VGQPGWARPRAGPYLSAPGVGLLPMQAGSATATLCCMRLCGPAPLLGYFLAILAAAAPVSFATFPGRNGRIAFTAVDVPSGEKGHMGIVAIDPDGSDPRMLADPIAGGPTYRPDGRVIAFARFRRTLANVQGELLYVFQPRGIFLMRSNGTAERRLIAGNYAEPDWSPDGQRLVLTRGRAGDHDSRQIVIWSHGHLRPLTDGSSPAWSPTGRLIAFTRDDPLGAGGWSRVYVVRPNGTGLRALRRGYDPNWSPDGRKLYYNDLEASIYRIRPDGRDPHLIARHGFNALNYPTPSPDGQLIGYATRSLADADFLVTIAMANGKKTRIFNLSTWPGLPFTADHLGKLDWQAVPRR
jgi:Tol biopolymer transport system component